MANRPAPQRVVGCALAAALAFAFPHDISADAAESDWGAGTLASVRLLSADDRLPPADLVEIAVEIKIPAGSKTYWHSPGLAGVATSIDWRSSENAETVELDWPTPTRLIDPAILSLSSIGYRDGMTLLARVTPKDPRQALTFTVEVELGVCDDVCILDYATTTLTLEPHGAASMESQTVARFGPLLDHAAFPEPNGSHGLAIIGAEPINGDLLAIEAHSDAGFAKPDLFPHNADPACHERLETMIHDLHRATFHIPARCASERDAIEVTLADGPHAITATARIGSAN